MRRLIIIFLFICPSAFAAYTTMTIEGVKQANGVWTAAGVMDTQGFVRTTGAVSVLGTTRNLPVAAAVDIPAASRLLKLSTKAMGPIALAAAAYDVYDWVTAGDIDANGNEWTKSLTAESVKNDFAIYTSACVNFTGSGCAHFLSSTSFNGLLKEAESKATYPQFQLPMVLQWNTYTVKCNSQPSSQACQSSIRFHQPNNGPTSFGWLTFWSPSDPRISKDPLTDRDFLNLPDPSLPVLSSGWSKIPSLMGQPWPINGTTFTPYSEWMGDPYFKNGNWWRDRMDVSPSGTSTSPTRVKVDIGPVKIEGATNPETVPDTGPAGGSGGAPQPEKEKPSFCEENPQSIACVEMGSLEQEPFDPIEKPFQITPQNPWGSGDAQCPAPKVMQLTTGSTVTLSYQPACDFFRGVRPAVLALALLAALYIALGIPVGKGD